MELDKFNVYTYIYTTISKEESPRNKAGFQTVCYPDFFENDTVNYIERRIFKPENLRDVKVSGFFLNLKNEFFYVLSFLKDLPEERDAFGRRGVFIVQGFLFPERVWRILSTKSLISLIEKYTVNSRQEAFNLPFVDNMEGKTHAIQIDIQDIQSLLTITPSVQSDYEYKLLIALTKLTDRDIEKVIAIKTNIDGFLNLIDKLLFYMPFDLKLKLFWDSAMDNVSLGDVKPNVLAFSSNPPSGADFLKIDAESIEHSLNNGFFQPETPFERWLFYCKNEVNLKTIDAVYNLYQFLGNGRKVNKDEGLFSSECFLDVNKKYLEEVFIERFQGDFNQSICRLVVDRFNVKQIYQFVVFSFLKRDKAIKLLSKEIANLILKNNLRIEELGGSIPPVLLRYGGLKLRLINKILEKKPITEREFEKLNNESKVEIIKYAIRHKGKIPSIVDVLKKDKDFFEKMLSDFALRSKIEEILRSKLKKMYTFGEISDIVFEMAKRENKLFDLINSIVFPCKLLEKGFRNNMFTDSQLEKLVRWGSKNKNIKFICTKERFPYFHVFLFPDSDLLSKIGENDKLRGKIIKILLKFHRFKTEDLVKFGFKESEIKEVERKLLQEKNLFDRVKGYLANIIKWIK